jgi:hypothetical protein
MQASVQEAEATRIIVLLAAMAIVTFWRTVVKWLIAVASTAIIATLGFGLVMIWQSMHHIAG